MPRATTKTEVSERIVARLIDQVADFGTANCFISVDDDPDIGSQHNIYCAVTPMGGRFSDADQAGAGSEVIFYEGTVAIRIYSRMKLDRNGYSAAMLNEVSRGLFTLEHQVVKALAGHDLLDGSGNEILSRYLWVVSDTEPTHERVLDKGDLTLQFGTDFLWDFSA